MRILVTGGAGFIGSNLVHALIGGHELGVIDDLSTGRMDNVHPAAWFRRLDILDGSLAEAISAFAPEVVVHLAAQASVAESFRDPERNRAVNVDGTVAVASAASAAGARVVLSASSAAVYGEPSELPLGEVAAKVPTNPYGRSKLEAEAALAECLAGTGTDFASLRFSNVYGPRQDWRGEGGVVAVFAARMTAGEPPTINGDGSQTRDFVYVGDVIGALLAAIEGDERLATGPGPDGPAYNVSSGQETSVETLARLMRAPARYTGPVEHGPAREGDVARSALDPAKASQVFGWRAEVPLERGLAVTVSWFARNR